MRYTSLGCVVTVYNKTKVSNLIECLDSIISQVKKPNEILIVVDGPVYGELCIFLKNLNLDLKFQTILTKVIYLNENHGPGVARNIGVEKSSSDIIAVMDSDDICKINRFELQMSAFEKDPSLVVCGGYIQEFSMVGTERIYSKIRKVKLLSNQIKKQLSVKSPVNNVTAMFRRDQFLKVGGYPNKRTSEDYVLWAKFLFFGHKILNIPEVIVDVRFEPQHVNNRGGAKVFLDDFQTQKFLLSKKMISLLTFCRNIFLYFVFRFFPVNLKKKLINIILRS